MTKLIEALKRVNDQIDYENEKNLVDDGLFSSFDIVDAISEIEETFGIEIPPSEIKNENFKSTQSIMEMIKSIQNS